MGSVVEIDPDGDLMVILSKPKSSFEYYRSYASLDKSTVKPSTLPNSNAQYPSLFGTHFQVPRLFDTDTPPSSLFGTETQAPSSSNTNTRAPGLFGTDAPPSSLFGTETQAPSSSNTNTRAPGLVDTDAQAPSSSDTNTRAPGLVDTDAQVLSSSNNNKMFKRLSARMVQFKVSSKHLTLASPRFKKMLSGEWLEASTVHQDGCRHVKIEGFDARSLKIVLNVLHGKNRKVPRTVDIHLLTDIAVLVDDLECHEEIEVFSETWIAQLRHELPTKWTTTLVPWIFVSFNFGKSDIYTQATRTAILHAPGRINPCGLPLRFTTYSDLNFRRESAIQNAISYGKYVMTQLLEGKAGCSFACQSILLGAWMKGLQPLNILEAPKSPFTGICVSQLHQDMRKIPSPQWGSKSDDKKEYEQHQCNFRAFTMHIGELYDSIDGLTDVVRI